MKRRDFIRTSLLATAGLTLISCEDNELIIDDTPGRLTKTNNPKNIIIIGAGISGLVAGFELINTTSYPSSRNALQACVPE